MNLALGLFHFNPHWNLDTRSAHRHLAESFVPLLRSIATHPTWHVTIEMSGIGLEFGQNAYPQAMALLRSLIDRGQVELISSLYTPNIWIAFPARDLLRSVELNRKCLDKLKLPWSRTFFSQEGFFGTGVSLLGEYFDLAICKDDYLSYYYDVGLLNPRFKLNGMKVVVASNHLLNELGRAMASDPAFAERHHLLHNHRCHLLRASELNRPENFPCAKGECGQTAWWWYHCGDGNHFGTMYKPDDLQRCYFDSVWSSMCEKQMESYEHLGYRLATIGEFGGSLDFATAPELPALVEGAWNPRLSDGVSRWMGSNDTPWENDAAVLASIARARTRLVAAEQAHPEQEILLQKAWNSLLQAQISDALGWSAGPQAVNHAFRALDEVLFATSQLLEDQDLHDLETPSGFGEPWNVDLRAPEANEYLELFGAEGTGGCTSAWAGVVIYDCEFRTVEKRAGIRFSFDMRELVYCPSGMERSPAHIPCGLIKSRCVSLPLANGLLQIAPCVFVIKDTRWVHVAATIDLEERKVVFSIKDDMPGKQYSWRFYIVKGHLARAVEIANAVNFV